ncbi:MAG: KH domain-containing protein [Synergistaceae bacterium]|jgi:spoIIIJ-associated protein|nr:KH domain-containing protein [Synergistaceae bacterium]
MNNSGSGRESAIEVREMAVETMVLDAPSIDAAKVQAADLWKVSAGDLDVKVLDDGKRLFGLLGRKMKLEVSTRYPLMLIQARDFAESVMGQSELGLNASLGDNCIVNLDGEDSAIIIGRHGETLKALEFLTNLIYRSDQTMPKIRFDCGGYRVRREESLVRLAESVAREVIHKHTAISLEPMSSWERRIIHLALQDNVDISTTSEGEEPMRKIVIYPRAGNSERRRRTGKRRF